MKQEEHARQMAELREHANRLQQENERLRIRPETNQAESLQEASQHVPPTRTNKGKEPALPDHNDPSADDELSSGSSPLLYHSPPRSNAEAESIKRPPCHSSPAISGTHRRTLREANKDKSHSELAPEHMPNRVGGMAPRFLPAQYPYEVPPALNVASYPPVRRPYNMISSPLGQHILDYEPPRGFVILPLLCTTAPLIHTIICCTLTRQ